MKDENDHFYGGAVDGHLNGGSAAEMNVFRAGGSGNYSAGFEIGNDHFLVVSGIKDGSSLFLAGVRDI